MKMYCVFARESLAKMGGNRGKMSAQAGHAFLHAYWSAETHFPEDAECYRNSDRAYKITLAVDTVEQLNELASAYKSKCGVAMVTDAAFTVFDEPTTTCLGIGPIHPDLIGDDLKALKVLI